jgi:hypothetical protein
MKCIGAALLGWTVVAHTGLLQPHAAPPPVSGRLAGAVLLGEAPLRPQDLPEDLSSSDRMRLTAYLERWNAFRTRHGVVAGSVDTLVRRERIEREIASVIEYPGIEQVAHAIAWGQGPYGVTTDSQQEVAWAENLVRDPANAVAAPFLYAFLASRYRTQFERADEDRPALERLAKKSTTMLDRVRNAGDGLFILLADDLDNRPTLSSTATRHPREYLPDS